MIWTVGQKVYIAIPSTYGHDRGTVKSLHEGIVTKVGKRWVTYQYEGRPRSTDRFDMATGALDGGEYSSRGNAWPSPEAFNAWTELTKEWKAFQDRVSRLYGRVPRSFTAEQVRGWREALEAALKNDEGEDA